MMARENKNSLNKTKFYSPRSSDSRIWKLCKNGYLFVYNSVMLVLFFKVHSNLLYHMSHGSIDDAKVEQIARLVKLLTYTQLMESIHPMLKLVPGGPMMPFLQVIGRLLVNYFLSESDIRLAAFPYAHRLFLVWSTIEIFRYCYYALRIVGLSLGVIAWCRYSLFIPLYPMGGFCESMVLKSTIKFYQDRGFTGFSLPNCLNISIEIDTLLNVYIYLLLIPSICILMRYMWTQRSKQLGTKTHR